MVKVSVLISAYQAEKEIGRCLNSILNQSLKDFEVIIINDGSTDQTGTIIEAYSQKFNQIKVFTQDNQGLIRGRTRGIEEANGDYVLMVDHDDWIHPNTLKMLYEKAVQEEADIVTYNYIEVRGTQGVLKPGIDAVTMWSKLFKTSYIRQLDFADFPKVSYWDDCLVNFLFQLYPHKKVHLNEYLYYYATHSNSAMFTIKDNYADDGIAVYRYLENRLKKEQDNKKYLNELYNWFKDAYKWFQSVKEKNPACAKKLEQFYDQITNETHLNLRLLLGDYFVDAFQINVNKQYKIEKIPATKLIVPERIDIIAKMKYIELREKGYDLTYAREVYTEHIKAFSSGTFVEPGNKEKNSIEKYFKAFDELIASIKKDGVKESISVIPVGSNNAILNGSHRVAIAAYFNLEVPIIRFENLKCNYGTNFFKQRWLSENYLDYLVTEYSKVNKEKETYIAICWPKANGKGAETETIIKKYAKIVYKKQIKLTANGMRNLVIQTYLSETWLGNYENHFQGTINFLKGRYDGSNGEIKVYVLESENLDEIVKMKSEVRTLFKMGNNSIHTTDNQSETVSLAKVLLNENSIDFLNYGSPDSFIKFRKEIDKFKLKLKLNDFSLDAFIIESSSVLGVYGLREPNDIDFLTVEARYKVVEDAYAENHAQYSGYHEETIDTLLFNPNKYFIYNELKFLTLQQLRKYKENRNESKDKIDIALIDKFQNDCSPN